MWWGEVDKIGGRDKQRYSGRITGEEERRNGILQGKTLAQKRRKVLSPHTHVLYVTPTHMHQGWQAGGVKCDTSYMPVHVQSGIHKSLKKTSSPPSHTHVFIHLHSVWMLCNLRSHLALARGGIDLNWAWYKHWKYITAVGWKVRFSKMSACQEEQLCFLLDCTDFSLI